MNNTCGVPWLACLSPPKHVNLQQRPAAKPRPVRVIAVLHQVRRGGAALVEREDVDPDGTKASTPGRSPATAGARHVLAVLLVESPRVCPPASERPCLPTIALTPPRLSHGSIERERNPRARPIRIAHAALAGSSFFSEGGVRCNRRQEFGPSLPLWRSEFDLRLGGGRGGAASFLLGCVWFSGPPVPAKSNQTQSHLMGYRRGCVMA